MCFYSRPTVLKGVSQSSPRVFSCIHLTNHFPDGVAPRAKMNQQRSRRFRSAKEAREKDEDKAALLELLKQQNRGPLEEGKEEQVLKKTWDSNAITPGTPFMNLLAMCLRYWCQYKSTTDPAWEKVCVIDSQDYQNAY